MALASGCLLVQWHDCGKSELCVFVGFLLFSTIFQNSPELHHNVTRISPEVTRISKYVHLMFARTSNWSTLNKGITTTQPSHMHDPRDVSLVQWILTGQSSGILPRMLTCASPGVQPLAPSFCCSHHNRRTDGSSHKRVVYRHTAHASVISTVLQ